MDVSHVGRVSGGVCLSPAPQLRQRGDAGDLGCQNRVTVNLKPDNI